MELAVGVADNGEGSRDFKNDWLSQKNFSGLPEKLKTLCLGNPR
jgi:hypothetical protein